MFGLALAFALASGVGLAAWAATEDLPAPRAAPMVTGPLLPRGPLLDRILDDAQASPTQRAQVHQIFDAADAGVRQGRDADRADHAEMAQLFAQPVVDAVQAEAVRVRIEARRDAQSHRVLQAMLDVSQVLTPDQRQVLARRLADGAHPFGAPYPAAPAANE